jgi:hypothetical protein
MYKIQFRRGVSNNWSAQIPILSTGEPGYEIDTGLFKIGDGLSHWNDLPYASNEPLPGDPASLEDHILSDLPHPVYDEGPSLALSTRMRRCDFVTPSSNQ